MIARMNGLSYLLMVGRKTFQERFKNLLRTLSGTPFRNRSAFWNRSKNTVCQSKNGLFKNRLIKIGSISKFGGISKIGPIKNSSKIGSTLKLNTEKKSNQFCWDVMQFPGSGGKNGWDPPMRFTKVQLESNSRRTHPRRACERYCDY